MYRRNIKQKSKLSKKVTENKINVNTKVKSLSDSSATSFEVKCNKINNKTTDDKLKSILNNDKNNSIVKNNNFLSESDTDSENIMQTRNQLAVKDEVLSTNCSQLKKIIMSKTRELFDKNNDFYHKTDTILKNCNQFVKNNNNNNKNLLLSPRKTRSRTFSKNVLTSCDNSFNLCNIGVPISCSTFANCDLPETCNLPSTSSKKTIAPTPTLAATPTNITPQVNSANKINSKPLIINIQNCNYLLNKQNSNEINTIIDQQTMELTPVQGNCILSNTNNDKLSINKLSDINRFSMDVNTSLDNIYSKSPDNEDDNIDQNVKHGQAKMTVINEENEDGLIIDNSIENKVNELSTSDKESDDHYDAVEGTPELTQKSHLLIRRNISQLLTPKNNYLINRKENHEGKDRNSNQLESTIILDNLTLDKNHKISKKGTIIIDETSEDSGNDSDADRNKLIMETVKNKLSIGKRRLFTQHSSPVALSSISPISSGLSPMLSPKKKKWVKRRRVRKSVTIAPTVCTRSQSSINSNNSNSFNLKRALVSSSTQPNLQVQQEDRIENNNDKKNKQKNKKDKRKRIVKSKKIVNIKTKRPNLLSLVSQKASQREVFSDDSPRRSSVFMENKRLVKKSRIHSKSIIIVATGLCNGDKDIVRAALKKIGGAKLESTVTKKTTHVVTTGVRTINLLRGIIRGCWLISFEWVKKSIEASSWLPPDEYEIQHFSKVLKENRRDREIFGNSYVPELFTTCGLIHIQNNTTPPRDLLKELIKTAGGQTIDDPKKAKITIGPTGTKELWVLDSITTGELQPTDQYKR
ncbi:putative uncharacterized protein DDB_G0282133 isoform X1 [Cotesia glomerata]|uniref:BRCT domain-containing protein n=2 Tax=Cotesia glomerata TaxID=32391 RepID=A0AAV7IHU0_COTGL|nr:putative uncharacterized protein DDB_G0282133 isoform X1 [Cotesia glomerata]KAH0561215.1 hypothetical protein KQX54_014735 [Cotesia glomerata]